VSGFFVLHPKHGVFALKPPAWDGEIKFANLSAKSGFLGFFPKSPKFERK